MMTVGEVQLTFEEYFPFLRIEFYELYKNGRIHRRKLPADAVFNRFLKAGNTGSVQILPDITVSSLSQMVSDAFHLEAQILRKSGNVWLPSSVTDNWTLSHQNHIGQVLSGQLDKSRGRR